MRLNHGNRNVSSIVLLAGLFTGPAFGQTFYTNYPTGQATSPNEMVAGPDGALWFTNLFQGTIGRITTSGQVTIYPVAGGSDPQAITAGPDGALWFANSFSNEIDRITTSGQVTAYTLPTANTQPYGITVGPDGNIWTSEQNGGNLAQITLTGAITEFPTGGNGESQTITAGPDGALWFAYAGQGEIGRMTTAGAVSIYTPAICAVNICLPPGGIATGPDGALWFYMPVIPAAGLGSAPATVYIGRITIAGVVTNMYPLPTPDPYAVPFGKIISGPDGALWFTEPYQAVNTIGRITTSGTITEYTPGNITNPYGFGSNDQGIAVGPDGKIWYAFLYNSIIGKIPTPGGEAEVNVSAFDFGSVGVDASSSPLTVTVTNNGASTLTFAATPIGIGGAGASAFRIPAGGTCSATLAAGSQCQFQVVFVPAAATGFAATLQLSDTAGNSPQSISLSGTGVYAGPPNGSQTYAFGNVNVGSTSTQTITVNNPSTVAEYIAPITLTGATAQFQIVDGCQYAIGSGIPPGQSCTISVTFQPTAPGAFQGQFTISGGGGAANPGEAITLTGTGVAAAGTLSTNTLFFPNVTTAIGYVSAGLPVTLTNTGNTPLTVTNVQSTDGAVDFPYSNGCVSAVPPGQSCVITVYFSPNHAGPFSSTFTITDNAPDSPQSFTASGTGVNGPADETALLSITSSAIRPNLMHVYSGTITLRNTSPFILNSLYLVLADLPAGVTATNASQTVAAGPAYLLNGALGPGQSATVTVQFTDPSGALITFTPKVYSGPVQ